MKNNVIELQGPIGEIWKLQSGINSWAE